MSVFGTPTFGSGSAAGPIASVSASPVATVSGDLIVVAVEWTTAADTTAVTDTAGNTYSALTLQNVSSETLQMFYVIGATANASNVVKATFTPGSGAFTAIGVWDFPISGGTVTFDTQAGNATTSVTTLATSSFNTAGADELVVVAASANGNNNGAAYTPGSGYTLDGFSGIAIGGQHRLFTSAQTGITASMSWSSSGNARIVAGAFKGTASSGGTGKGFLLTLGVGR